MSVASLKLEGYSFRKISVEALPSRPSQETPTDLTLTVTCVRDKDTQDQFRITLKAVFGPQSSAEEKAGYAGEVVVVGRFIADSAYPEESKEDMVREEGSAFLFGAVREMLASVTARGPWRRLTLPWMNFQHLLNSKAEAPESDLIEE